MLLNNLDKDTDSRFRSFRLFSANSFPGAALNLATVVAVFLLLANFAYHPSDKNRGLLFVFGLGFLILCGLILPIASHAWLWSRRYQATPYSISPIALGFLIGRWMVEAVCLALAYMVSAEGISAVFVSDDPHANKLLNSFSFGVQQVYGGFIVMSLTVYVAFGIVFAAIFVWDRHYEHVQTS